MIEMEVRERAARGSAGSCGGEGVIRGRRVERRMETGRFSRSVWKEAKSPCYRSALLVVIEWKNPEIALTLAKRSSDTAAA